MYIEPLIGEQTYGEDYGAGGTTIDADGLAMRRMMRQDAPDGLYRIRYRACMSEEKSITSAVNFTLQRSGE